MRKLKRTSILTQHELDALAQGLRQVLGRPLLDAAKSYGLSIDSFLRFMPVAEKCRVAREENDFSLKEAALKLKIPQYRLREIESGNLRAIDGATLESYVELLGLRRWFGQWARLNRSLHGDIIEKRRLTPRPSGRAEKRRRALRAPRRRAA